VPPLSCGVRLCLSGCADGRALQVLTRSFYFASFRAFRCYPLMRLCFVKAGCHNEAGSTFRAGCKRYIACFYWPVCSPGKCIVYEYQLTTYKFSGVHLFRDPLSAKCLKKSFAATDNLLFLQPLQHKYNMLRVNSSLAQLVRASDC
jgi:hypothetical protein